MVAIKDMEMPKYCNDCEFCHDSFGYCNLASEYIPGHSFFKDENEKPDFCPLVEIVTCKDCKHREKVHPDWKHDKKAKVYFCTLQSDEYCYEVKDDYFCKDGERKE
jgi:hypothetical protein